MVCLSIAGHTVQGYTGCHKHVCGIAWFDTCDIQTQWHARSKRICDTGYFNDLVQHKRSCANICVPAIGARGFKVGSWVDVAKSADDKILCEIVVCSYGERPTR